jgi:hypothetical protein
MLPAAGSTYAGDTRLVFQAAEKLGHFSEFFDHIGQLTEHKAEQQQQELIQQRNRQDALKSVHLIA